MLAFTDARGPVEVAFTDRHAAAGGGPSASLDLGEPPLDAADLDDRLAALAAGLDNVAAVLARERPAGRVPEADDGTAKPTLVRMRQVHGSTVHVVDRPWLDGHPQAHPRAEADALVRADALVTELPGVALLVRVADCVPVLLGDADRGIVAAVHAGRLGLVAGVVPAAVRSMRTRGAERIHAWIGPHVCGSCYEVPGSMREEVAAVVPEAFAETSWGTPAVDVGAGVRAQLRAEGVDDLVDVARCTLEDDDLYSHRRQGARAGRMAGLVWVRP